MSEAFINHLTEGVKMKGDSIILGGGMLDGECVHNAHVRIPLKTMNRHGLIAGATGTGKTVTLQIIAEQLSNKGVPVLLMDLKGDLSGLAAKGANNSHIEKRHGAIGLDYAESAFPVELLSLTGKNGVKLRATVSEFGPVLFSKMLGLNDTQSGITSLLFKYADDNKLPLLDIKDFKKLLQYSTQEGKEELEKEYGRLSTASTSAILRKIIEQEQQGADEFFGELSFDVQDLLGEDRDGKGKVSIIRLTDIQDKPKLFSTFMLSLLAEVYNTFPEIGDPDKPKLCIFIDEAHLIFDKASDELIDHLEAIIKLIRSKGVGIYFSTQNPSDIPADVLSQLGLKVQHALRAFTARDRKAIKQVAENYPISDYYDTAEILTSLGIGEAFITGLDEKGRPTPLVATLLRAPQSRMGPLKPAEIKRLLANSVLVERYNKTVDRESAYEMLTARIEEAQTEENQSKKRKEREEAAKSVKDSESSKSRKKEDSFLSTLSKNTMLRQLGRTMIREVTRGLLGALGVPKLGR